MPDDGMNENVAHIAEGLTLCANGLSIIVFVGADIGAPMPSALDKRRFFRYNYDIKTDRRNCVP